MIDNYFEYTHKGKKKLKGITEDIYTFKCSLNVSYIVEVENHEYDIYIVKFFQKNHRHSDNRYSLVNSKKFLERHKTTGTKNFLTILNTILKINIEIYNSNNKASFGFMGAPTNLELDPSKTTKIINLDGTVAETKRFNTYSIYVKRYFSPDNFEHIEISTSSCYLIKSKKNLDLTTDKIEDFFEKYISLYC
ncbi:hypothetical protein [Aestuariibaculum sediminum]|uniref:Uncharacterized protein n=1 Tax=Aestuariibaculum sediminum TaxID=2770637 RepID=A0A8J6UE90_9FLAO|nr:hypothetical protein [Aestuariibaculum sediminum]MBD0833744.1 hypothetical protein [Aestuariibaculum sediminum]